MAAPTILRTSYKFGDYLTKPDLAKFELPKKMSRPWIVNNAYEQNRLRGMMGGDKMVETKDVIMQIKDVRNKIDKKKAGGYNKKNVKNINDIIKSDKKQVKPRNNDNASVHDGKKEGVTTKIRGEQRDATPRSNVVPAGQVGRKEDDSAVVVEKLEMAAMDNERMVERQNSINEKEQQAMMNRMFNSPSMYTATEQFTTTSSSLASSSHPLASISQPLTSSSLPSLFPVAVANPQGGHYIVYLPLHPLPPLQTPPLATSSPSPSLSSTSFSSSYPCSSASSDDGFEEGEMSEDGGSLAGDNEDKLNLSEDEDRQDAPQDKDRLEDEEFAILDEQLERLVLSIIDD